MMIFNEKERCQCRIAYIVLKLKRMENPTVDFNSNKLIYVNINSLIAWQSKLIISSECPDKETVQRGEISSSEERSLQEFCSQYNVDETACKSYVEHLKFLDATVKKKIVRKRNALPSNISWKMKQIWKRLRTTAENVFETTWSQDTRK